MSLTPGQWQAVDAIVSQHTRNPALAEAVEKACAEAWRHVEALSQSSSEEGRMPSTYTNGPGGAGNTETRGLATSKEWLE